MYQKLGNFQTQFLSIAQSSGFVLPSTSDYTTKHIDSLFLKKVGIVCK